MENTKDLLLQARQNVAIKHGYADWFQIDMTEEEPRERAETKASMIDEIAVEYARLLSSLPNTEERKTAEEILKSKIRHRQNISSNNMTWVGIPYADALEAVVAASQQTEAMAKEIEGLKEWKQQQIAVWSPVDEFIRPHCKLGERVSIKALRFCEGFIQLQSELSAMRESVERRIEALKEQKSVLLKGPFDEFSFSEQIMTINLEIKFLQSLNPTKQD